MGHLLKLTHFIFNKFTIYTYDGASDKSSTKSHETDYSARGVCSPGLSENFTLQFVDGGVNHRATGNLGQLLFTGIFRKT
jgi:hypothetical protein